MILRLRFRMKAQLQFVCANNWKENHQKKNSLFIQISQKLYLCQILIGWLYIVLKLSQNSYRTKTKLIEWIAQNEATLLIQVKYWGKNKANTRLNLLKASSWATTTFDCTTNWCTIYGILKHMRSSLRRQWLRQLHKSDDSRPTMSVVNNVRIRSSMLTGRQREGRSVLKCGNKRVHVVIMRKWCQGIHWPSIALPSQSLQLQLRLDSDFLLSQSNERLSIRRN